MFFSLGYLLQCTIILLIVQLIKHNESAVIFDIEKTKLTCQLEENKVLCESKSDPSVNQKCEEQYTKKICDAVKSTFIYIKRRNLNPTSIKITNKGRLFCFKKGKKGKTPKLSSSPTKTSTLETTGTTPTSLSTESSTETKSTIKAPLTTQSATPAPTTLTTTAPSIETPPTSPPITTSTATSPTTESSTAPSTTLAETTEPEPTPEIVPPFDCKDLSYMNRISYQIMTGHDPC